MLEMYGPFSPSIEMRNASKVRRARIAAAGNRYGKVVTARDDAEIAARLELARIPMKEPWFRMVTDDELIEPRDPHRIPRIKEIQATCARHFKVSRGDILSARRQANIVWPRQIAMFLSKEITLRSYPDIGRHFGGRDHTTVLHAVQKITRLIGLDYVLSEEIQALRAELVA